MRALIPAETGSPAAVAAPPSPISPGPQSGSQPPPTVTATLRVTYQGFLLNPTPTGARVVPLQGDDESGTRREQLIGAAPDPEEALRQRRQELSEAKERQEALLRQTPAGSGFSWLLERQIMFHDGRIYVNNGPTQTLPSHDLAHLLVGLGSNLPWCPVGPDREVRLSEFNAAVLENLLSYTYEHVARRSIARDAILPSTLQYARWFVEKHYAPFPIPLEEAYRRFCRGIDAAAIMDLAHYFFTQKERERQSARRDGPWEMLLIRQPSAILDAPAQQFQTLLQSILESIRARQTDSAATVRFDKQDTRVQQDEKSAARNEPSIGVEAEPHRTPEDPQRRQVLREARNRQEALVRRTPAGSGFSWLVERQIMFHRRRIYINDGPTETLPSHDLAHLLVGMGSNLPWCPTGPDAEVRISEFNAAVLENLLSYTYEHVACRSMDLDAILPATLKYARWFVEKHYSPFPIPLEEAYRRFCLGIDAEAITSLAHYFFAQKELERPGKRRDGPWEMRLVRQSPAALSTPAQQFQSLTRSTLQFMKARQNSSGAFA